MASTYTHTATLYGHVYDVPVRQDGPYWVSRHEVHLALWHRRRDVTDLRPIPAAVVEQLREDLAKAQEKLASLRATAERLSQPRNEYETDMATVSGIRRKPNPRADARRYARYDREAAAWKAVTDQETTVKVLERRIADAIRDTPVPYTDEQLRAATHVRTRMGWEKVVRVNAKTVSVETGYSWVDRIPLEKVIEVRTVTPS